MQERNSRKVVKGTVLLIVLTMMLSVFGLTVLAEEPQVLKFAGEFEDMLLLDVHKHTTSDVMQAALPALEPLLRIIDGEVEPLLVEEMPTLDEEGVTYTFKLKEGVKFHNGQELTANDVYYTFHRIFDPATQNVNTWLCDMIVGGKAMLEGEADELEGVKVIDDYTFTIEIEDPLAPFLAILATTQLGIYPAEACEEAGEAWGSSPDLFSGTGPFKVVEFVAGDYVKYEKNTEYHGELALLDELYMYNKDPGTGIMEFQAEQIDVVVVPHTMVEPFKAEAYADNLVTIPIAGIIAMNMNVEKPPLDDVKVREAISYAVDQETLANKTLLGNVNPNSCMIPPGILGYDEDRPATKYDPEKAKALLAEAGYPDGIEIETTVSEKSTILNVAVALQEQFKASNITLNIAKVDDASYIDMRKAGEVQVPFLTWYADYYDPDNFLYTFYFSTNSGAFSSNWNDEKTDELMLKGRAAPQEEREAIYVELENYIVNEQFVTVPLYNPVFYYLVNSEVEGIRFANSEVFFDKASK